MTVTHDYPARHGLIRFRWRMANQSKLNTLKLAFKVQQWPPDQNRVDRHIAMMQEELGPCFSRQVVLEGSDVIFFGDDHKFAGKIVSGETGEGSYFTPATVGDLLGWAGNLAAAGIGPGDILSILSIGSDLLDLAGEIASPVLGAIVVRKETGSLQRNRRGRLYMGPAQKNQVDHLGRLVTDNGLFLSDCQFKKTQDAWNHIRARTGVQGGNPIPVLAESLGIFTRWPRAVMNPGEKWPGHVPQTAWEYTPVTEFVVDERIGSQRRRARRRAQVV